MTTPEADWWPRFSAGLDCLLNPGKWLCAPPTGVPVGQLLLAARRLGISTSQTDPSREASQLMRSRANTRELLSDLAAEVAAAVMVGIAEAVGADEQDIIRPSTFGRTVLLYRQAGAPGNGTLRDQLMACGVIASLPPDHPLRTVPEHELYVHGLVRTEGQPANGKLTVAYESGTAVIALGPCDPLTGKPKAWYDLPSALALTAALRARQVEEDNAYLDKLRIEKLEEQNRWWTSPEGIAEQQRRTTAWRIKRGLVPPPPPDVPPDPDEMPVAATARGTTR